MDGVFYEDWRQEDLTDSLGQVHCSVYAVHHGASYCPFCKAAV